MSNHHAALVKVETQDQVESLAVALERLASMIREDAPTDASVDEERYIREMSDPENWRRIRRMDSGPMRVRVDIRWR